MARDEIEEARSGLAQALGAEGYGAYCALLSAFLGGRLSRVELEDGLLALFGDDAAGLRGRHNALLVRVLARLAAAEAGALQAVRAERRVDAIRGSGAASLFHGAASKMDVRSFLSATITEADQALFSDAMSASPVSADDGGIERRLEDELSAVCATSLLAQACGSLPDAEAVRAVLGACARAFGLDADSPAEEHVALLVRGVEAAVSAAVRDALVFAAHPGEDGGGPVVDREALLRAAAADRRPLHVGDPLLLEQP